MNARTVISAFVLSTLSAGCASSNSGPNVAPPTVDSVRPNASLRVLHSFAGGSDGAYSQAPLVLVNGDFYGTTGGGGGNGCVSGCGTVFKVTADGQESIVYAFKGGQDGESPSGPLTYISGKLYGTTSFGGGTPCIYAPRVHGCGTIFEINLSGTERVLYRFPGRKLGAFPTDGLLYVNGAFYGEANGGVNGASCTGNNLDSCGLIYKMSARGHVSVVHAFDGTDGAFPKGGLLHFGGNFYGVTTGRAKGGGTLFRISPSGVATTLHNFVGSRPTGLVPLYGFLYASASGGGSNCMGMITAPCGSIVRFDLSGDEKVVYGFKGHSDGGFPNKIIAVGGNLYGTTYLGGQGCVGSDSSGCGTVFEVKPDGRETILYRFNGTDGAQPLSALIGVRGTLYGTTFGGGSHDSGTVFQITP